MSSVDEYIVQADELHNKDDIQNSFALLDNAVNNEGKKDPRLMWRLGRANYLLGQETTDKDKRKEFISRGLDLVQSAVKECPDDGGANKWAGILLGKMGEFLPTKEKIANAYNIRDYFTKAISANPNDATAYHCLGTWHWNILQIGFVERGVASMLFGSPPSTTYEACEEALLASDKLDPVQVYNSVLLGDLYYQQKKWDAAKTYYKKAAECPVRTEAQKRQQEEALTKLAKC